MTEEKKRYSECEFSPIGENPDAATEAKLAESSGQKSAVRQWINKNLTLVVTLAGVFIGVVEGASLFGLHLK